MHLHRLQTPVNENNAYIVTTLSIVMITCDSMIQTVLYFKC